MISPGLFRLLLASIVVISHFSKFDLGRAAVDLFFILSGFWIYCMFEAKYMRSAFPGTLFIASRYMRLLPVFLLFNILALALHSTLNDNVAAAQSMIDVIPNFFIIGYASLHERPLGPAWSLDIELQFYLLFPLIFLAVRAAPQYARIMLPLVLVAGGTYLTFFVRDDHAGNILPYSGFFLAGLLSARTGWKPSIRLTYGTALLAILGLATLVTVPALRGIVLQNDEAAVGWNAGWNFMLAVLLAPVALSSVYAKSSRRDRLAGDMSYVVYCCHWLAVTVAAQYLSDVSRTTKAPLIVALVVATYLISFMVLLYVDQPISRWRERWVARHLMYAGAVQVLQD